MSQARDEIRSESARLLRESAIGSNFCSHLTFRKPFLDLDKEKEPQEEKNVIVFVDFDRYSLLIL